MRPALVLLAALVGWPLVGSSPAQAQAPHATLLDWQDGLDLALRDRAHNTGGLYHDRGLWRAYTPLMDEEYALDLFGLRLSPAEAYDHLARTELGTSYVGLMASVEQTALATGHRFRTWRPAADRMAFELDVATEETFSRAGGVTTIGVDALLGRRDRLGHVRPDGLRVGVRQTFGLYKPDLDFSLRAAVGRLPTGRAAVAVHALDFANNTIYVARGVSRAIHDTIRAYERTPVGVAASVSTPPQRVGAWSLRGELVGGASTPSRARVESASSGGTFVWTDAAGYAGGLVEVSRGWARGGVAVGAVLRDQRSRSEREDASGAGYASRQRSASGGVFVLASWRSVRAEAWLEGGTYADEQDGTDFSEASVGSAFRYAETVRRVRLRAGIAPARGVRLELRYLARGSSDRTGADALSEYLDVLPTVGGGPGRFDHRLSGSIGYGFRPGTWFVVGSNGDLDRDRGLSGKAWRFYDGGFGRVVFAL